MNRDEIQKEAFESLLKNYNDGNNRLILNITMRVGKTRIALLFLKEKKIKEVDILVPYKTNIETWKKEKELIYPELKINILNYRSITKLKSEYIILDEIQSLTMNKYKLAKDKLENAKLLLGLTGTLPRDLNKLFVLLHKLNFLISYTYELKNAIEDNIINDFELVIIYSKLDIKKNIQIKTKNFNFKTSEKKSYNYYTKKIAQYPSKKNRLARASILYNLKSKIETTKSLLNLINNKKTLIFTKRIEIAKLICKNVIDSKSNDNEKLLSDFINDKTNYLATIEMLKLGVTIPNIDYIIIESFDSNPGVFIQKIARGLLKTDENKKLKVFIIVAKNTVEEEWVNKIIPSFKKVKKFNYYLGNFNKIEE